MDAFNQQYLDRVRADKDNPYQALGALRQLDDEFDTVGASLNRIYDVFEILGVPATEAQTAMDKVAVARKHLRDERALREAQVRSIEMSLDHSPFCGQDGGGICTC